MASESKQPMKFFGPAGPELMGAGFDLVDEALDAVLLRITTERLKAELHGLRSSICSLPDRQDKTSQAVWSRSDLPAVEAFLSLLSQRGGALAKQHKPL